MLRRCIKRHLRAWFDKLAEKRAKRQYSDSHPSVHGTNLPFRQDWPSKNVEPIDTVANDCQYTKAIKKFHLLTSIAKLSHAI